MSARSRNVSIPAWSAVIVLLAAIVTPVARAADGDTLPDGFVFLRDVAPDIEQDMRYASVRNFTSRPVSGYVAAECVLTRATARALGDVQKALAGSGFALRVYDCYRPTRATAAFMDWLRIPDRGEDTRRYHPNVERSKLADAGYISRTSSHSAGNTVDLTLVRREAGSDGAKAAQDQCGSEPDGSVDMGTGFDCFDVLSHASAAGLSRAQRKARRILSDAMRARGFRGYAKEWWHFSYDREPRGPLRNFAIPARTPAAAGRK